ncbi:MULTISPECIES: hypothetical protein [Saccharothrix]|uniref:hypothetical protein n=1 Tax=Saccharothrix TaxID=2071 RepID=UPI000938CF44|nr:hypothetical protein [Saccharothrix sp. CB00851]OKI35443.1 hypothetical protein A6A25_23475 [Saccharothrix sp. CB00851]
MPVFPVVMPPPVTVTVAWSVGLTRPAGKFLRTVMVFGEAHEPKSTEPVCDRARVSSTAPVLGFTRYSVVPLAR